MSRTLILLLPLCFGSVFAADMDENSQRLLAHFKTLDLPYTEPSRCGNDEACAVSDDFNGDGVADVAGIFVYTGDQRRRSNRKADLVILYSGKNSDTPEHEIFSPVGQVDPETGSTNVSLGVQGAGPLKVPSGEITLDQPAINVYFGPDRAPNQFLTYRWRNDRFYGVDKSDD